MTDRYAKIWFDVKYALFLLGFVALCWGILGHDRSFSQDNPASAFVLAFGIAILIGWPPGGRRFNLNSPEDRIKVSCLTAIDLVLRMFLVVAIELLMREFEARYAFKAKFALLTLLSFYVLHPVLPLKTPSSVIKRIWSLHLLSMLGMFGLFMIALALMFHDSLSLVWCTLIGTGGLGIVFGSFAEYIDDDRRRGSEMPFGIFMVGIFATVVGSYLLGLRWGLIAATAVYILTTLLTAALHDVYYPEITKEG